MKKILLITTIMIILFSTCTSTIDFIPTYAEVEIRNFSTIDGIELTLTNTENNYRIHVGKSLQSGYFKKIVSNVEYGIYDWIVERTSISYIIDSGIIDIENNKSCIIEGRPNVNNGNWSANWFDR